MNTKWLSELWRYRELLAFDGYVELQFDIPALVVLKLLFGVLVGLLAYACLRWAAAGGTAWLSVALKAAPSRWVRPAAAGRAPGWA